MEDDPSIKVLIRTGTSTRPSAVTEADFLDEDESVAGIITITTTIFPETEFLNFISQRTLNEGELKRNPETVLDIRPKKCLEADLLQSCSICQNKFVDTSKMCYPRCGHKFHYECLSEWVKYKPECPLCRARLPVK